MFITLAEVMRLSSRVKWLRVPKAKWKLKHQGSFAFFLGEWGDFYAPWTPSSSLVSSRITILPRKMCLQRMRKPHELLVLKGIMGRYYFCVSFII